MKEQSNCILSDIITLQRGYDLTKKQMNVGAYPVAGSNGIIGYNDKYTTEGIGVTIGRSGNIGNAFLYKKNFWAHNTTLFVKDFKSNHPLFVYYLLKSINFKQFNSGSAVPSLNRNHINNIPILYHNLPTQKKIASILSALDDKIELNNKINKNLEEMAQAIFKSWFVDFEPWSGEMPNDWEYGTLGDICNCKLGGTPSRNKKEFWGGEISWINSGKVNEFRIIEDSEKITELGLQKSSTKLLPKKTIVIAITGATLGQISLLEIQSCANQSVVGIIPNKNIPYEYIFPYLKTNINQLTSHQTGGAQQHINKQNIENFNILVPEKEILHKYQKTVSSIYNKITINCFENKNLTNLRDTLLPKLMSGELNVSNIEF